MVSYFIADFVKRQVRRVGGEIEGGVPFNFALQSAVAVVQDLTAGGHHPRTLDGDGVFLNAVIVSVVSDFETGLG